MVLSSIKIMKGRQIHKFLRYVSFVSRVFHDSCTQLDDLADPSLIGSKKAKCIE